MLGAEDDVVRVLYEKLHITSKEMQDYLKQANLEKYGFEKNVEISTKTGKNGKTTKKTIYYLVTDDCSRVMFWEGVLEQRLPKKLKVSTTVKEVQSRITGRKTKSCTVGLEIHTNRFSDKTVGNGESKRTASGHGCNAWWCSSQSNGESKRTASGHRCNAWWCSSH